MVKANSIDADLVDQMLHGMSIVGDIARSRRWPATQGTEDLSLDKLRSERDKIGSHTTHKKGLGGYNGGCGGEGHSRSILQSP